MVENTLGIHEQEKRWKELSFGKGEGYFFPQTRKGKSKADKYI